MKDYYLLLANGPGAAEAAVRSILATTSRAKLAAAWSVLKAHSAGQQVQVALEAAKNRWTALNYSKEDDSIDRNKASRYQRDLAHTLLAEPAMQVNWPWVLPLLADPLLSWQQACTLLDQLLLARRSQPRQAPLPCAWVDCF